MDDYLSESEQVDRIKRWLKENLPWALAGVLIAVGGLVGWNQYQSYRAREAEAAAEMYTQALDALTRSDRDAASKLAQQLKTEHAKSPYADLAELALARFHVDEGKYPEAAKYLEDVMNTSQDTELRLVARLRLARVQRAAGQLDQALTTLKGANPGGFGPAFAEVRGDVLLDKGDRAGALAAYQEASAAKEAALVDRDLLTLKIADLGGTPPAQQASALATTAVAQ